MRSIEEIDRDFAGIKHCQRPNSGCSYPSCTCSRAGAVPVQKQTLLEFSHCTKHPEDFIVLDQRTGEKWIGQRAHIMRQAIAERSPSTRWFLLLWWASLGNGRGRG